MRYTVGVSSGRPRAVELDNTTLLGRGGEKAVHRDPGNPRSEALAVYHNPSPARAGKVEAFLRGGIKFPKNVAAPLEDVRDASGQVVGFGMPLINRRYVKLKQLFVPSFRQDHKITTRVICDVYLKAGIDLAWVHKDLGVVGDLNDGGLLIHEENFDVVWVDVDSWGVKGFPCIVGTRLYLCPALYGIDLAQGGNHFEPWHDDWSYCVLLFRSLLGQHPFKAGSHPRYTDVTDRARNGLTLLDREVDSGNVKFHPGLLTDDMADALLKRLKMREKSPFPMDLLRNYREELAECPSCGHWYPTSRANCPCCSAITAVDLRRLGVEVTEIIRTGGRVLHLQLDGSTIYCVAEEAAELVLYVKEPNRQAVRMPVGVPYQGGMRFAIFQKTLVICQDDDVDSDDANLFLLDVTPNGVTPVVQTTTSVLAGRGPVFDASPRFLYRVAGNMLLAVERFAGNNLAPRPVVEVFPHQCWFRVDQNPGNGKETIFGVNRDTAKDMWFVVTGKPDGSEFVRRDVALPELLRGESLVDVSVRFDAGTVLVLRKTLWRGVERIRIEAVHASDGRVLSSEVVDPGQNPLWDGIHGKAYARGVVMHATDTGIVPEVLAGHQAKPALRDSAAFVSASDNLYRFDKGVLVARQSDVLLVTPR